MEFFAYITPLLIIYVLDVLLKRKVSYNLPVVINPSQYIWTGEEQGLSRSFKSTMLIYLLFLFFSFSWQLMSDVHHFHLWLTIARIANKTNEVTL